MREEKEDFEGIVIVLVNNYRTLQTERHRSFELIIGGVVIGGLAFLITSLVNPCKPTGSGKYSAYTKGAFRKDTDTRNSNILFSIFQHLVSKNTIAQP